MKNKRRTQNNTKVKINENKNEKIIKKK